jgi:carbonic anhydrase
MSRKQAVSAGISGGGAASYHQHEIGGCACCSGDHSEMAVPLSSHQSLSGRSVSRRAWLRAGVAGLAAAAVMPASALWPRAASAQSTLAPDAALAQMMAGNARFAAKKLTSLDDDLSILQQNTVDKQEPYAAVLSCADSRVPVELIFDQTIGHLFVTRVAGNLASTEMIASLEYGTAVLGARAILVLGHSSCGAIKATIAAKEVPGQISALYAPLRAAVDAAGPDLAAAAKANAKIQAHLLATASPVLAGLIKDGKLVIAAGYYDLASGKVEQLT